MNLQWIFRQMHHRHYCPQVWQLFGEIAVLNLVTTRSTAVRRQGEVFKVWALKLLLNPNCQILIIVE